MKVNNELAMREFDQGIEHYPVAEQLFLQNVRDYPSYITYNNLAWYHYLGGEKDPLMYCRKALRMQRNILSLRVLRRLMDNEHLLADNSPRKLRKLIAILEEVLTISDDPVDGYFMGVLLFRAKRYHEALGYLEKACNEVQIRDVKRMQVTLSICLSRLGRQEEAYMIAEKLYQIYMDRYLVDKYFYTNELTPFDLIDMFYLTGNYERVVKLGEILPEHGMVWTCRRLLNFYIAVRWRILSKNTRPSGMI